MMLVRPARLHDATRIAAIHVDAWQAAYPGLVPDALLATINLPAREASWAQALSGGKSFVVVAEDSRGILGWSQFGASRDPDVERSTGEIYGMYVAPSAWRSGVGTALWHASKAELEGRFEMVTLWVIEANAQARRFYEKCGFVVEPHTVNKPDWLGVNRIRYRHPIRGAS